MNDANSLRDFSNITLKIGDWRLYPALNRLERGDEVVHLEPKAVSVLEILVSREGQPVSRQELLDYVWENTIVSDDALTQVIIKLRKAFGDNSRRPDYIQTIPKRGYRLLAPVEVITSIPSAPENKRLFSLQNVIAILPILVTAAYFLSQWLLPETIDGQQVVETDAVTESMSISVQPFEVVDKNSASKAFALGITSDLITDLSKLSALRIIHLSANTDRTPGSRYLVTGNVQKIGQHLKLHVNLIETETQFQLWSERYNGKLDQIFEMQQRVSEEIVKQLSITVTAIEKERLAKRYTRNLSAYENFLAGQTELLRREKTANQKARDWYRQAIEDDPDFARAYAGLALSYAADFRNQWVEDGLAALKKARDMAETAQQIDPTIPEVYWVLGYVDTQYREHDSALQALSRAVELDPSYADAYALMGGINTYKGEPKKTVSLLREAIRLRPDAGFLYYLLLGRAYFFLGDYEQAMINLEETVERNPESLEAHLYIAASSVANGKLDMAAWERDEIESLEAYFDLSGWFETYPMTDIGQINNLKARLKKIGL